MIKEGMFVRCPIDREYPYDPRIFVTGKVLSINEFNETAHIKFSDPFDQKKYFEYIPDEIEEAPLATLEHCYLFKESLVKWERKTYKVVEYNSNDIGFFEYYLQDRVNKEYRCVNEVDLVTSFISGRANPIQQLKKYEFQNPCWYLGRQVVKDTMNVLNNSILGFKELAGCKIYLKAFQLNTIMQCLQSECCRYMLADEVGLGKTIEACAVLKIYLSNNSEKQVLITVPKVLIAQWRTELLFKFELTFAPEQRLVSESLLYELEKINNTRVGYYDRHSGEQTILVSIKRNCNSDAKRYAAYKTLKCTVKYLRRISDVSSYDSRFLLAVKFFLFYLFDENPVVIKPTINRDICVVCTRGKNKRKKELQALLKSSIGNDDENHEVKFLRSQIIKDSINDTTITIPASIIVYKKDTVGRKLSEFDGLVIHPMRKSNQVIFLEAKNRDKNPSLAKKCLIEKFEKFSFEYMPDSIEIVDYDAFLKYSIK